MSERLIPLPAALRQLGVEPVQTAGRRWVVRGDELAALVLALYGRGDAPDVRAAGQLALRLAVAALEKMRPDELPAAVAVRLLDIGTRLERGSVEQPEQPAVDPWEVIARELAGPEPEIRHAAPS